MAGECYPKFTDDEPNIRGIVGAYCPACSKTGMPETDRVFVDCIDAELTRSQKLLLAP